MARMDRNNPVGLRIGPTPFGPATRENQGTDFAVFDDAEFEVFIEWGGSDRLPVHHEKRLLREQW